MTALVHTIIIGNPLDDEGECILDCLEEAQDWLSPERQGVLRRYDCALRFESAGEAIAWFEAQAISCDTEAHRHVEFGVPGKNV